MIVKAGDNEPQRCDAILRLATACGPDKTICPSEVARGLAGSDPDKWRPFMAPVRAAAVALAKAGSVDIRQAGTLVKPDNFTGVFRIAVHK